MKSFFIKSNNVGILFKMKYTNNVDDFIKIFENHFIHSDYFYVIFKKYLMKFKYKKNDFKNLCKSLKIKLLDDKKYIYNDNTIITYSFFCEYFFYNEIKKHHIQITLKNDKFHKKIRGKTRN